jgi:hypothetical protein
MPFGHGGASGRRLGCFVILRESKALLNRYFAGVFADLPGRPATAICSFTEAAFARQIAARSALSVEVRDFEEEQSLD